MAEPNRQQLIQVAEQLQSQLEQLEQQNQQLVQFLDELEQTKDAIDTVEEAGEDEQVLLPLGSGAYVHARLSDPDAVLAPIGGGVLAEEPPTKALERIESREKEAREAQQEVQDNMQQLQDQLQSLVSSLQGQGPPGGQPPEQPEGPGSAG